MVSRFVRARRTMYARVRACVRVGSVPRRDDDACARTIRRPNGFEDVAILPDSDGRVRRALLATAADRRTSTRSPLVVTACCDDDRVRVWDLGVVRSLAVWPAPSDDGDVAWTLSVAESTLRWYDPPPIDDDDDDDDEGRPSEAGDGGPRPRAATAKVASSSGFGRAGRRACVRAFFDVSAPIFGDSIRCIW